MGDTTERKGKPKRGVTVKRSKTATPFKKTVGKCCPNPEGGQMEEKRRKARTKRGQS